MNTHQFSRLPANEQIDFLYREGSYIGKRKQDFYTILIYQLESFYVEIYYIKHRQFITSINCFRSTTVLDPFLQEMKIDVLVGL